VLDANNTASGVWAHTAYRSSANVDLLDRRGLVPEFQRPKPLGRPMPAHITRGNATRARVRSVTEHVFATEKRRMGLIVRSIGLVRATTRITLANLPHNMHRLVWIEGRCATARPAQAPGRPARRHTSPTTSTLTSARLRLHLHLPSPAHHRRVIRGVREIFRHDRRRYLPSTMVTIATTRRLAREGTPKLQRNYFTLPRTQKCPLNLPA